MKPLYLKAFVALLLFSAHYQVFANNKHAHVNGGFSLISFSPMSAKAGDTVQITGTGFSGITSVSFGGVAATSFVVTSSTTIKAYVGVGGSGNVLVAAGLALDSLSGFVYQSAPVVHSVSPAQGYPGDTIYFHGQNLLGVSEITFGGVDASFTVISDTLLWARVSAPSQIIFIYKNVGPDYIYLFTGFTIEDSTSPAILSFTPDTAYINQSVIIRGRHFTNASSVQFGSLAANSFTVISDSVITATVGAGSSGAVSVTTTKGTGSLPGFYFIPYQTPVKLLSFSPNKGTIGDDILIRGTGLGNTQAVYFGGTQCSFFTILSDTLISAELNTGSSGYILVNTSQNGMDSLPGFTYEQLGSHPVVLSFTPDSGTQGTHVRIYGYNFSLARAVNFGLCLADSFHIISDSLIDAVVGSCGSGAVDVANAGGDGYLNGFTYNYLTPPNTGYSINSFSATAGNGNTVIRWEIGNDAGIANFIVQRAPDSVSFVPIDSVAPINNWGTNDYSATDDHMLSGLNNYRLAVVDTLGNIKYSIIVTINNGVNSPVVNTNTIKLYPNPTTENITIDHPSSADQSAITVMDMMGKTLKTINVPPNSTETKIDLGGTYQGLYRIVWTDGKTTISGNLLIQPH